MKIAVLVMVAGLLLTSIFLYTTGDGGSHRLLDIDGVRHGTLTNAESDATILFFLATSCPISNQYAPEIVRICNEYDAKGAGCFLVFPEQGLTSEKLKQHLNDYGLRAPAILDPEHELVSKAGATVTPEASVFSRTGALLYRGRIDDRHVDFGRAQPEPARRDLRDALEAITSDRPVPTQETEAVGCFIETAP